MSMKEAPQPIPFPDRIEGGGDSQRALVWESYLEELQVEPGRLSAGQAIRVVGFWRTLCTQLDGPSIPTGASALEGDRFAMVWDNGRHHFEVELRPDGLYDWFYMDRESTLREGAENLPSGVVKADLLQALRRATVESQSWSAPRGLAEEPLPRGTDQAGRLE